MTFVQDANAIQAIFAQRAGSLPNAPVIIYENAPGSAPPLDAPWIRFAVRPLAERQAAFTQPGQTRHIRLGRVEIQIFVPRGTGTAALEGLTEAVASIWRGASTGEIRFRGIDVFNIDEERYLARRLSILYETSRYV